MKGLECTIGGLLNLVCNGPAAVIVFFIISGFCIHYPNRRKVSLGVPAFYSKRFIRIIIPAVIAFSLYRVAGISLQAPNYGLFWSIICELIYYILYPLIFLLRKRVGFIPVILISYAAAYGVVFSHLDVVRQDSEYFAFGSLTWLIGLPCWLLGCWLSESEARFSIITEKKMWLTRIGIFGLSFALFVAQSHVYPVLSGFSMTLNLFAIPACLWIGYEIAYFKHHAPLPMLESAGLWSYSLYITHPLIPASLLLAGFNTPSIAFERTLVLSLSFLFAYLFYRLVEKPAHRIAYKFSKRLTT